MKNNISAVIKEERIRKEQVKRIIIFKKMREKRKKRIKINDYASMLSALCNERSLSVVCAYTIV